MPSLNTGNAILSNPIKVDSSYNVGIGGAASGSFKLQVTGASNFIGVLTATDGTQGLNIRAYTGGAGFGAIYSTGVTAGAGNFALAASATQTILSGVDNVNLAINSAIKLAIASTGAATFSSSVYSSGSLQVAPTTGTGMIGVGDNFGGNMNAGIYRGGAGVTTSGNYLNIGGYDGVVITTGNAALGSQTTRLTIASTGAATFSSSVTATQSLILNGTNPNFDLQNAGTSRFRAELDGSNFTYLSTIGANDMILRTNSTERMRITSGGNVGIGTSSPSGKLDVRTNANTSTIYLGTTAASQVADSGPQISFNGYLAGDPSSNYTHAMIRGAARSSTTNTNGGVLLFYTSEDSLALTEKMRITSNGNVGIGETAPSALLHVNRNGATNATTAIIRQTGAGGNGNQDIGLLVDIQGAGDSDRIANFRYYNGTSYDSKMAIFRNGRVGIQNTAPQGKLEVGIVDTNTTYGGHFFSTFSVPVNTWTTVFYAPNNNWAAITEFTWTSSGDYNRSGAAYMRWAYVSATDSLGVVYTLFNNDQNAAAQFRNSGGEIQVYITGGASSYHVQVRIQGSKAA